MEVEEVWIEVFHVIVGSVVRKWVLEAATTVNGPWIPLSCHPEDDTFFYDVTDGQNKENSFL